MTTGNENDSGNWKLNRVYYAIYGNGKDGLDKRVDRLEQARLSAKEQWALYMALGCGVVNLFASTAPAVLAWFGK